MERRKKSGGISGVKCQAARALLVVKRLEKVIMKA